MTTDFDVLVITLETLIVD